MKTISQLAAALALAALACRAVGPEHEAPELALAATWNEPAHATLAPQPAELAAWWRKLGAPMLDALVTRALAENLDLGQSLARVREARALRAVAAGERWPTLDARAGWRRSGESENTPLGAFVPDTGVSSAGFDAAWELDLWGRLQRTREAADAELGASVEDARAVAVTVAAEVARNYVEWCAFGRRLTLAQENVELQRETLALVQGRLAAGLVGESDVTQARTNVERTRSAVPLLASGRAAAEARLAVRVGAPPGALAAELAHAAPIPVPPLTLAVGVPADLLRRRADVRRAERALAAETARIGVAEAELYPTLTLSGSLGLAAESLGDFLRDDSGTFALGPSLRWNLFDGGRTRARVAALEARAEQARLRWEATVLLALEECEGAMARLLAEQERRAALRAATLDAQLSVELARTQYQQGLSDFQAVLVSERTLAELEDTLATSEAALATHLVALYKALGGGWEQGELAGALASIEPTTRASE
jgi:NodT family efflux transporter outer membrane factor (OMF) lipoprotein